MQLPTPSPNPTKTFVLSVTMSKIDKNHCWNIPSVLVAKIRLDSALSKILNPSLSKSPKDGSVGPDETGPMRLTQESIWKILVALNLLGRPAHIKLSGIWKPTLGIVRSKRPYSPTSVLLQVSTKSFAKSGMSSFHSLSGYELAQAGHRMHKYFHIVPHTLTL